VNSNLPTSQAEGREPAWRPTWTWVHFSERARHYRFAAAVADSACEVDMFHSLAMMFERLAHDFGRFEIDKRRTD